MGLSINDVQTVQGSIDIDSIAIPSTLYAGQTTVAAAGTAVALTTSQAVKGVMIKALHDNAGMIYVGGSDVDSTTGYVLDGGEQLFLDIANLATVFIDSDENDDGVSYIATN